MQRLEILAEAIAASAVSARVSGAEHLSHVLLRADQGNGKLGITATNLDASLVSWCEAEVDQGGEALVPAKRLVELLRAIDADQVALSGGGAPGDVGSTGVEGKRPAKWPRVMLATSRSRFHLQSLVPSDAPRVEMPEDKGAVRVVLPAADLAEGIAMIDHALARGKTAFTTEAAQFQVTTSKRRSQLRLTTTDDHRVATVELSTDGGYKTPRGKAGEAAVLVSRHGFDGFAAVKGADELGDVTFDVGQSRHSFSAGRRRLIFRALDVGFPLFQSVIDQKRETAMEAEASALLSALRRVRLFVTRKVEAATLALPEDAEEAVLRIEAANPDLGDAFEEVPCVRSGEAFEGAKFNPRYLVDAVEAARTDRVRLSYAPLYPNRGIRVDQVVGADESVCPATMIVAGQT